MSTKKKMSVGHRAVIKSVFGIEPDEFVTEDFEKLLENWARRVGHGYVNDTRLRYDDANDKWVVAQKGEPYLGYVKNGVLIPEGPLGGVDILGGMSIPSELLEDDNEVEQYCDCSNPKCNLPNGMFCSNPLPE